MLKELRARYEKGRLVTPEGLEPPPDGAEVLVIYEAPPRTMRAPAPDGRTRGAWAGRFPPDFDIDRELAEIRSGWMKRLEDFGG
jgi:hypothetical protein